MKQREIKFRFFDGEKMCEVGELTFFTDNAGYHINEEFPSNGVDPYPLMQFTGLKDKNGKEIYEGDIVRYAFDGGLNARALGSVQWSNVNSAFQVVAPSKVEMTQSWDMWLDSDPCWEVIGNIYQNPDLLTSN